MQASDVKVNGVEVKRIRLGGEVLFEKDKGVIVELSSIKLVSNDLRLTNNGSSFNGWRLTTTRRSGIIWIGSAKQININLKEGFVFNMCYFSKESQSLSELPDAYSFLGTHGAYWEGEDKWLRTSGVYDIPPETKTTLVVIAKTDTNASTIGLQASDVFNSITIKQ